MTVIQGLISLTSIRSIHQVRLVCRRESVEVGGRPDLETGRMLEGVDVDRLQHVAGRSAGQPILCWKGRGSSGRDSEQEQAQRLEKRRHVARICKHLRRQMQLVR